MSTAVQRHKRKTAGRRMTTLVGKAQEQDDEFWGHTTWADSGDSGNESFRDSDEDSELKKDAFDSDFNDSETDNEEEEKAAGEEEERALKRHERSKRAGSNYVDVAASKKKGRGKRIIGDGINAGIVLNLPPQIEGSAVASPAAQVQPPQTAPLTAAASPATSTAKKPAKRISLASTRQRRSQSITKRLRENRSTAPTSGPIRNSSKTGIKKSKRRLYKQEELLLEAVHQTETENERWLLARKRVKDAEQDKDSLSMRDRSKGKIIQKFHSRRGCLMTLTFPEMDSVPDILTRPKSDPVKHAKVFCVVTGKAARYRDPLTKLGYFDLAAFKELRRRNASNEPLDQRTKEETRTISTEKKSEDIPADATRDKTQSVSTTPPETMSAPQTPQSRGRDVTHKSAGAPPLSPASLNGRRASPRSRKPSKKMMQNIVANQQKARSTPGLSTHMTMLDTASPTSNPTASTPTPEPTEPIAPVTVTKLPGFDCSKSNPSTSKENDITEKIGTKRKSSPAKSAANGGVSTGAGNKSAKTLNPKIPMANPGTEAVASVPTTIPSSSTSGPTQEPVYPIPKEKPTANSPQKFISQSELIRQVISNYSKQNPEKGE